MKIGVMINDIFTSLFKKPVTVLYPAEPMPTPDRYRGELHYDVSKCVGCMMCVRDCPANALELNILDRKTKKFVMRYRADRCIYCGQCVISCRFNCLSMPNNEWELASLTSEPFTIYYGRDEDIQMLLSKAETAVEAALPPVKVTPMKAEIEDAEPFMAKGATGRNDDDGK